jgi:uncharacterized membrane protein YqjE
VTEAPQRGGLFGSLRALASTAVGLLQVRLELLATELQEEKVRLLGLAAFGTAAVFFLAAGAIFLAVFLTVLYWDEHRLLVLGLASLVFLAGGLLFALLALRAARSGSRLFAASLAELRQDKAALDKEADGR